MPLCSQQAKGIAVGTGIAVVVIISIILIAISFGTLETYEGM